jgi:hypothetical protein
MFLKRQGSNVRFYSPVVSKGTLLVAGAAVGVILKQLMDWKTQEAQHIPFSEFDVRIMWAAVGYAAILQWIAYMDTTVARHKDEKKKRDETDAFAKAQTVIEGHLR